MQAAFASHWFRFSTEVQDVDDVLDSIAGVSGGDFGPVEHRGMFNQPMRFLHDTGAAVYFGSKRDQPIVVEVPGEACELVTTDALATWAGNVNGRVTRIDVAADLEPAGAARKRLVEMRETFRKGQCVTRIPKTSTRFYENDTPGEEGCTLYVGSTSSDVMLRAYDRRGPLRIEWQWKPSDREVRATLPSVLQRYGPAGMWRHLGASCVWPCTWYQQLLKGECADIVHAPKRPDDLARTMAAIIEQLGPTLGAMQLAGVHLGELAVVPKKPNAEQVRKWAAWVAQARDLGYDPSRLDAKVKRCRRSN
jgi:hypothetical protein